MEDNKRKVWWREIRDMGFELHPMMVILMFAISVAVAVVLGLFYKLPLPAIIVLIATAVFVAPRLVRNYFKSKYEKKLFADVNVYIEQMLYAFRDTEKIFTSLQNVQILFPQGTIRKCIDHAIEIIASPSGNSQYQTAEEAALRYLEEQFPNRNVREAHDLMLKAEIHGGDSEHAIDLLLENRRLWEERTDILISNIKQSHVQIILSVLIALGLVASMLYILPTDVDITKNIVVQVADTLSIVIGFLIYRQADSRLAFSLIDRKDQRDADRVMREYDRYISYTPGIALRKSLIYAIIPLFILILAIRYHSMPITILAILGACITAVSQPLAQKRREKMLKSEVEIAFPQWLMTISLMLQTENVHVAIISSIDDAPEILKPELKILKEGLEKNPESPEPYMNFCHIFDLPNIMTSMQMLYSVSSGNGGDPQEQIANIVQRNNYQLDRAEKIADDRSLNGMRTMFLLPSLVGAFALIADIAVFLVLFMNEALKMV